MVCSVYVSINEGGHICAIDSSKYLTDLTGWVKVDEGEGERYEEAQTQYLENGIYDGEWLHNYKLVGGVVKLCTKDDKGAERSSMSHKIANSLVVQRWNPYIAWSPDKSFGVLALPDARYYAISGRGSLSVEYFEMSSSTFSTDDVYIDSSKCIIRDMPKGKALAFVHEPVEFVLYVGNSIDEIKWRILVQAGGERTYEEYT